METNFLQSLFFVLLLALAGGVLAKSVKMPTIIGYILAGIVGRVILPKDSVDIQNLAEVGVILLLFSVGLELSLTKLTRVGKVAIIGAFCEITLVTLVGSMLLFSLGMPVREAIVLAIGFSLSSTAVVVKMLEDRAETESIHGEIMIGWLLTQDLAVIPLMAVLPLLGSTGGLTLNTLYSFLISILTIVALFFAGRIVAPIFMKAVTRVNSRELLLVGGVSLALGTAYIVSLTGITPALGAFIAGLVIAETQENHAVFAETRPLRDIFSILFFVTLGFFVTPQIIASHALTIAMLVIIVLLLKFIITFSVLYFLNYHGKTAVTAALGMTQVGEFSFMFYLAASGKNIISEERALIGITTALITILATPFVFKLINPLWRRLKSSFSFSRQKALAHSKNEELTGHIIICGFGRMGRWIAKALSSAKVPYLVVDYNQQVVKEVRRMGIPVVYGDPSEPPVLNAANILNAKAVIIAIPDRVIQEEVISYCQNVVPNVPIYARAHLDEDVAKLSQLKVARVVQPEFEGAMSIAREVMHTMGKNKDEISERIKTLRRSHTLKL